MSQLLQHLHEETVRMRTINTADLDDTYDDHVNTLSTLIDKIPDDTEDPTYMDAVGDLANWLGVHEADHLEFFGTQPWVDAWAEDLCGGSWGRSDEAKEVYAINELRKELGRTGFRSGITLHPVEDKQTVAVEIANDSAIDDLSKWPYTHIDWSAAADDMDCGEVTYIGEKYFYLI